MSFKIIYGPHEIPVSDDVDIPALRQSIEKRINSGESGWVEINSKTHASSLLITPGIPIWIRESRKEGGAKVW